MFWKSSKFSNPYRTTNRAATIWNMIWSSWSLEKAATPTPERQSGDSVIPAEPPDWKDVRRRALKLFGRTKDLHLAIRLAEATLHLDGLPGFFEALTVLRGLVNRHWGAFHPRLDPDDGLDPTMRVNILLWLANGDACLQVLRESPLIDLPGLRKYSFRDYLVTTGQLPPRSNETPLAESSVKAALAKVDAKVLQERRDLIAAILKDVTDLEASITDKVGVEKAASFEPLAKLLTEMGHVLAAQGEKGGGGSPRGETSGPQGTADSPDIDPAPPGEVRSRTDVIVLLKTICEFYRLREPSSPVPILLRRAMRLATMDFMEILRDIAPSGLNEAQLLEGRAVAAGQDSESPTSGE